ncbi:spore germination protein [Salipaludibacillus sp. CUR1]|uniref:GerAB/ArcD/ProY family transporter n=1 Tax=Salipaludibacillus sp. CUR1 TaxID=2820003 RepID=UPI001E44A1A1|nr:endospore germination permease [Salipaludibacillus sp. CUR1]MCE7794050.1 spore germination protein [Salipaludibacillus sp. CUR1]
MKNIQQISWTQLVGVIVATKLTGTLTYGYIVKSEPFAEEAWMVPLIAGSFGLLIGLFVYKLSSRFPGQTVFQYSKKIMGTFLGWIINFIIVVLLIDWGGVTIRQFSEYYTSLKYLDTPLFIFSLLIALLAVQIVRGGVEVLGRQGVIMAFFVIFASLFIYFGSANRWELGEVPAPWELHMGELIQQSFTPLGVFGEVSWVVLLLLPHLNQFKDGPRAIIISTVINSIMVSAAAVVLIAVLGEDLVRLTIFPSFEVASAISFGVVVERIEWLVSLLWLGSMAVKLSVLLYGGAAGVQSMFQMKQFKNAIWIVISLMFIWSYLVFDNIHEIIGFLMPEKWLLHALPLQVGIPALLMLVALIRRVKG